MVVGADIFADGHDTLAAALSHRKRGEVDWLDADGAARQRSMAGALPTSRSWRPTNITIEAWVDRFAAGDTRCPRSSAPGRTLKSELLEGAALVRDALLRAPEAADDDHRVLSETAAVLGDETVGQPERVAARSRSTASAMAVSSIGRWRHATPAELLVIVDRERARFGAWYEMFPRSSGSDPDRSGTFRDAEERLPYIASMGFDVLYLPPIHPIGKALPQGPQQHARSGPDDVGSPWAIGAEPGGHDAVEPGLGTLEDFDRFVEPRSAAASRSRSISPTGPHPIIHACQGASGVVPPAPGRHDQVRGEPAQEIPGHLPINFESAEWQALWIELKRIVEFWIGHGVTIFRVDNPHTKPFRFWEWALADIKRQHPDTIFLSEAFTRPR